jgi:hypothetical protein
VPDFLQYLPSPLSPTARQFFTVWNRWRGERPLPRRREIRLADLGPQADLHLMLEIRNRNQMLFVSAGRTVADYLGVDVIGADYLEVTPPENRRLRQLLTLEQLLQPCGFVQYYWLNYAGGALLPVELAGAPLSGDDSDIADYLMCCCTPLMDYRPQGAADPESWSMGEGMRFIDVGFGIPPAMSASPQTQPTR